MSSQDQKTTNISRSGSNSYIQIKPRDSYHSLDEGCNKQNGTNDSIDTDYLGEVLIPCFMIIHRSVFLCFGRTYVTQLTKKQFSIIVLKAANRLK